MWYGPILFGDAWMNLVGLDLAAIEADPPGASEWITNVISSVVSMYALAWIYTKMNVDNWSKGVIYGFIIGFSFVILSTMTSNLFGKMPYELAWITGGFTTVGLMIGGAIFGAWKKYNS